MSPEDQHLLAPWAGRTTRKSLLSVTPPESRRERSGAGVVDGTALQWAEDAAPPGSPDRPERPEGEALTDRYGAWTFSSSSVIRCAALPGYLPEATASRFEASSPTWISATIPSGKCGAHLTGWRPGAFSVTLTS